MDADAAGDEGVSDTMGAGTVPGIVGFGGALAAGGGDAAGAGRAGGAVGMADFATGFTGVVVRAGAEAVGAGPGMERLTAEAGGTAAAEPGFATAVGRAVGAPAIVGLAGRVGVVADPDALVDVGEAPAADAVGEFAEGLAGATVVAVGAIADERTGAAAATGRAAADGGTEVRPAAAGEGVGFSVAVLLGAAATVSATPAGFRAAGATDEVAEELAGVADGIAVALELATAARRASAAEAGPVEAPEPAAAGLLEPSGAAEDALPTEPAPAPEAAEAAGPPAGVANAEGIVASFGPKSVASNRGDAQVPEYAESMGAVAHEPDDEALDVSAAVDDDFNVVVAGLTALVAEPAAMAAPGFFVAEGVAFEAGAVPDALGASALLPGPGVPGSRVGMPNPAGETSFCGSPAAALLVADGGAGTAAAAVGGVLSRVWGPAPGSADAGALLPGAFDPSGSSLSSN